MRRSYVHLPSQMSVTDKAISPTLRFTGMLVGLSFLALIVISALMQIEIVSKGAGRVVTQSREQLVQTDTSGRVAAIFAKEGNRVSAGQRLALLDSRDEEQKLDRVIFRIESLRASGRRYRAHLLEIEGSQKCEDSLSDSFASVYGSAIEKILRDNEALFRSECVERRQTRQLFTAQRATALNAADVASKSVERFDRILGIQAERLRSAEHLFSRGVLSKADLLNVLEKHSDLELQRQVAVAEERHLRSEVALIEERLQSFVSSEIKNHTKALAENVEKVDDLLFTKRDFEKELSSKLLKAPLGGIVTNLSVTTIGEFLQDGAEIMSITPHDEELYIEVLFDNREIGFIEAGQLVYVKIDAFPFERFGALKGTIALVSADSIEVADNVWGFHVKVALDDQLDAPGRDIVVKPGMTASVDVVTGSRSLLSYFFAPLKKIVGDSLRER